MNKAIFLDRDGVINKTLLKMGKQRAPYSLDEFQFIEGVREAVTKLHEAGFLLIVVTNQPDVQRGWVAREAVDLLNQHVLKELKVDDLLACFHTSADNCHCRKPKPGMLLDAAKKWDIDLSKSFMVGDRMSDMEAGKSAGCRTVLVGDGEEDVTALIPDHTSSTLSTSLSFLLNN